MIAPLLVVLLAQGPPPWAPAATTTVTKTADGGETVIVEVNGVKAGRRHNSDGTLDELVWERDPRALGLRHRLHAHRVTQPFPAERDPLPVPPEAPRDTPQALAAPTPVVIDVNFFYSAAAGAAWGLQNVAAKMALSCSLANETYANSGLAWITWRCFGPFPASYLESSGLNPLAWMNNSTQGKPEIDAKFPVTGADAAHMVTANNSCGQGYYFSSSAMFAYSMSHYSCTTGALTFVHELGHNINYRHDPTTEGCTAISPASGLPYCSGQKYYGHAFPAGAVKWRTIMAYPQAGGTRVTQISNPAILYQGVPTGIANERDNASIAVVNAPIVAAFRTPVTTGHKPAAPVTLTVTP